MSLTSQIVAALVSFCTEMASAPRPFARERELVSWFVLGHLAKQVRPASPLHHILQIGIEFACPQESRMENPRLFPDVCKDIVVWPQPRDLCWTQQGRPEQFPLSVIEWKALNRKDTLADLKRKRSEAKGRDADWLKWFTRQADGREGFSVVSDLTRSDFALSAWRCAAGSDLEPVFILMVERTVSNSRLLLASGSGSRRLRRRHWSSPFAAEPPDVRTHCQGASTS